MTVERIDPPLVAQEREMLDAWLDFHRATLAVKCEGLTDDQLRAQAVPPSSLSLLGLVRHMGEVERSWFRRVLGGEQAPPRYYSDENPDGDFDDVAGAGVAEAFGYWRDECAHARERVAAAPSLDVTGTGRRGESVLTALDHGPHDRGVRAAQRPRGPAPGADRRHGGRLSPAHRPGARARLRRSGGRSWTARRMPGRRSPTARPGTATNGL